MRFDEAWLADYRSRREAGRRGAPTNPPGSPQPVDRDRLQPVGVSHHGDPRAPAAGGEAVEKHSPRRSKREMRRPEEDLQKLQVAYLEWALMPPWRFLHIPNQRGTRKRWENELLKAMGVKEGAADLLLLGPVARFVWIENKSEIGRLSDAQKDWRRWCFDEAGADWYLCRSLDDLYDACIDAGVPLRGRPQ